MNCLKSLSNQELVSKTKELAAEERRIGIEVLRHLREIEARRLYAERYSSLHEFAVHELKYSDGAAYRRIQAMRLIREIPEIEESLGSGEVSLSTTSALGNFLRNEKKLSHDYTREEKVQLFDRIKGKSSRETEKIFATISPEATFRERERVLDAERVQVTFVMSKDLQEKLETLRNLLAHQCPNATYAELVETLADMALRKLDPAKKLPEKVPSKTPAAALSNSPSPASTPKLAAAANPRMIPASIRREVWRRAEGRCQYRSPGSKAPCASRYALQVDHVKPVGKGGKTELTNLQLLCRAHNQYKNLADYGFVWGEG